MSGAPPRVELHRSAETTKFPYLEDLNHYLDELFHAGHHLQQAEEWMRVASQERDLQRLLPNMEAQLRDVETMRNSIAHFLQQVTQELEERHR